MSSGAAARVLLHLPTLWALSRWLNLMSWNPWLCCLAVYGLPRPHSESNVSGKSVSVISLGKLATRGYQLFEIRFCCAKYAPLIHLWIRLTSFKSLCSALAQMLFFALAVALSLTGLCHCPSCVSLDVESCSAVATMVGLPLLHHVVQDSYDSMILQQSDGGAKLG